MDIACQQIPGRRPRQEDSLRLLCPVGRPDSDTGMLALVGDGMGGHRGGETASELACDTFVETFLTLDLSIQQRLRQAVDAANTALAELTRRQPALKGMGTTLLAAYLENTDLYWVSIGDSPLYLFRNGQLKRLNQDHSMTPVFDKMVAMGQMTHQAARQDPKRHALRSVLNGGPVKLQDQPDKAFSLKPNDRLVLASDGIEALSADAIGAALTPTAAPSAQQTLDALFRQLAQVDKPDQDNASAILLQVSAPGSVSRSLRSDPLVLAGALVLAAIILFLALWIPKAADATSDVTGSSQAPTPTVNEEAK